MEIYNMIPAKTILFEAIWGRKSEIAKAIFGALPFAILLKQSEGNQPQVLGEPAPHPGGTARPHKIKQFSL